MPKEPRLRWWPAALILVLLAAAVIWIWNTPAPSDQDRVISTAQSIIVASLLLLLWWILFSGVRWWTRAKGLLLIIALGILARVTLRVEGVTGNLVPRLAWRWSDAPDLVDKGAASRIEPFQIGADDYPQYLGKGRDAEMPDPGLFPDWQARPPKLLWKHGVGAAWSGFAVVGNAAVTMEQRGGDEHVVAYELRTGDVHWTHSYPSLYESTVAGEGPRSTPTLHEGRVYTLGARGVLNCLDFRTGSLVWQRDIQEDFDRGTPQYGRATSPLIVDDMVLINVGGEGSALVAYDKNTGEILWSGGTAKVSNVSPTLATLHGVRQVINFNSASVTSHSLENGSELWRYDLPEESIRCAQPLILSEELVFVSSGYGKGARLLRVRPGRAGGFEVQLAYHTIRLKSKFANMIFHKDYIFGLDDGIMTCIDPRDGSRQWKRGRYGHGQIIRVGGLLLVTNEDGDVALVDSDPSRFNEITRFTALDGAKVWNPPALAGNILLIRDHRQAAAYELPLAK